MYAIATKPKCPYCSSIRFWRIRRSKYKCKKCRREWSNTHQIAHIRSTHGDWERCIEEFLRQRAALKVSGETGICYTRTQKMLNTIRECMFSDIAGPFNGVCEADETFVGGQWKNKRIPIRRLGTKKGHGTSKIPIVGVLCRDTGEVRVQVLKKRTGATYWAFIGSALSKEATLYTDGYKMNRGVINLGIKHDYVNHHKGEYVKGTVHTNGIEGFWGYLKRNLAMVGGIRKDRLELFVGEFTWRFNHRKLTRNEQVQRLLELLKQH